MFEKLQRYQPEVVRLITNSFAKGRIVHVYLFYGPKGSLKTEAALFLAKKLLTSCPDDCPGCDECRAIAKSPQLFRIDPENTQIVKEQILTLTHEFSLTSDFNRVFIIEDIDKATPAAGNSLLKFLEETAENSYAIMITENLNAVLPTIKSRSQLVRFKPLLDADIAKTLRRRKVGPEYADIIAMLASDFETAKALGEDIKVQSLIDLTEKMHEAIELGGGLNPFVVLGQEGRFLLKERLNDYHDYFVTLMIALQNEKLKYALGHEEPTLFPQYFEKAGVALSDEQEVKILEVLMELQAKCRYNVNRQLAYLQALIMIEEIING